MGKKYRKNWANCVTKYAKNEPEKMEQEMGDVFFALVNYARFIGVNPKMRWSARTKNSSPASNSWRKKSRPPEKTW